MTDQQSGALGALAPFRVLDLADERGAICGKMFADMGADVIKIEPPDGCPTRRIPPFLDGRAGLERSLYALAYHAGKRSLTLDLTRPEGRQIFIRLVATADFVVDTYPIDYLDGLGVGYEHLSEINSRLIYAAITPFGDAGPAANWKATDLVSWASGGMMFLAGNPDEPPLHLSFPQAGLQAGGEAAVACLLAHLGREQSGRGQKVVIDTQAAVAATMMNESPFPVLHGNILRRNGFMGGSPEVARKVGYRCADGFVFFVLSGGPYSATTRELIAWLDREGLAPDWLKKVEFEAWTPDNFMSATPEFMEEVRATEEAVQQLLLQVKRQEIYEFALEKDLMMGPVSTAEDIAGDIQLAARDYFQTLPYPALGRDLTLVGPFAKLSASPVVPARPAPTLGQHTQEILESELGFGAEQVGFLFASRVI